MEKVKKGIYGVSFLFLSFLCFKIYAMEENFDLIRLPQEEGWRWRGKFKVLTQEHHLPAQALDFSDIHKELDEKVAILTQNIKSLQGLEKNYSEKNICIGGISIIYNDGGTLKKSKFYQLEGTEEFLGKELSFISGTINPKDKKKLGKLSFYPKGGNSKLMDINDVTYYSLNFNGKYNFNDPPPKIFDSANYLHQTLTRNQHNVGPFTMGGLFGVEHSIARPGCQRIYENISSQFPEYYKPNFKRWDASYVDSEQAMLLYAKSHLRSILIKILSENGDFKKPTTHVKAIIFHGSTQRDMCELCALTFFRESELFMKGQEEFRKKQKELEREKDDLRKKNDDLKKEQDEQRDELRKIEENIIKNQKELEGGKSELKKNQKNPWKKPDELKGKQDDLKKKQDELRKIEENIIKNQKKIDETLPPLHLPPLHLWREIYEGLGKKMNATVKLLFMMSSNEPYMRSFSLPRYYFCGNDQTSLNSQEEDVLINLDKFSPYGIQISSNRKKISPPLLLLPEIPV